MENQENGTTKNGDQTNNVSTMKSQTSCDRDWFCVNFAWMVIMGVLTLFWIGRFTDYLESVIGLLGLGGIFAWVAFLFNVISESRKKELQTYFESFVKSKRTCLVLAIWTAVLILGSSNTGCITADSGLDTLNRYIEIRHPDSKKASRSGNLSPNTERKFPVFTGFHGKKYRIDVEGLPVVEELVRPFSRKRLKVPADLRRSSVVLVRPGGKLSEQSSHEGANFQLMVSLNDETFEVPFFGHTVWIGSGNKRLDIPTLLKEKWRIEVAMGEVADESTLIRWLDPTAFEKIVQLSPGQEIKIAVKATGVESLLAEVGPKKVLACEGEDDFPQVIDIDM